MPRYWPEPPFKHGSPQRTGVLLVNLGTPEAPTAAALRPYLKQFLSDPRVVEIPRLVWWPILNGIILNTRPAASAKKYASVWMDEGSPLKVHTARQAALLARHLAADGHGTLEVDYAMRYGSPSIRDVLDDLRSRGCTRILILPLYPQYSASTTATVVNEVGRCLAHWRNQPEVRFVRNFHDHPGYIAALVRSVREHWREHGEPDRLLLSFHGVPRRSLELGDPYHCECHKTGRLIAEGLDIARERVLVTFQSRFGKAEWLKPYTQPTLESLAAEGIERVERDVPRLRRRLSRNTRGNRDGVQGSLPRKGRQGLPLHSLPERRRGLDREPGRDRAGEPRQLARHHARRRRQCGSHARTRPRARCRSVTHPPRERRRRLSRRGSACRSWPGQRAAPEAPAAHARRAGARPLPGDARRRWRSGA